MSHQAKLYRILSEYQTGKIFALLSEKIFEKSKIAKMITPY